MSRLSAVLLVVVAIVAAAACDGGQGGDVSGELRRLEQVSPEPAGEAAQAFTRAARTAISAELSAGDRRRLAAVAVSDPWLGALGGVVGGPDPAPAEPRLELREEEVTELFESLASDEQALDAVVAGATAHLVAQVAAEVDEAASGPRFDPGRVAAPDRVRDLLAAIGEGLDRAGAPGRRRRHLVIAAVRQLTSDLEAGASPSRRRAPQDVTRLARAAAQAEVEQADDVRAALRELSVSASALVARVVYADPDARRLVAGPGDGSEPFEEWKRHPLVDDVATVGVRRAVEPPVYELLGDAIPDGLRRQSS